jgi:hypothetical protein
MARAGISRALAGIGTHFFKPRTLYSRYRRTFILRGERRKIYLQRRGWDQNGFWEKTRCRRTAKVLSLKSIRTLELRFFWCKWTEARTLKNYAHATFDIDNFEIKNPCVYFFIKKKKGAESAPFILCSDAETSASPVGDAEKFISSA